MPKITPKNIDYDNAKQYVEDCLTTFDTNCKDNVAAVSNANYDILCEAPLKAYQDFNVDNLYNGPRFAMTRGGKQYLAINYAMDSAYIQDPSWQLEALLCSSANCTESFINQHNQLKDCKFNILWSYDDDSVANDDPSAAFRASYGASIILPILWAIKFIDLSKAYDAASYIFNGVKDLFSGDAENKMEEIEKPKVRM